MAAFRQYTFWVLVCMSMVYVLPMWIFMAIILAYEKGMTGIFIMAYDPMGLRWLLSMTDVRKDQNTETIMEHGMPGVDYLDGIPTVSYAMLYYSCYQPFVYLSHLTGYTPECMKLAPSRDGVSSIYTTRMTFIDDHVEKKAKTGDIEQLLIIGAGWDFRAQEIAATYPGVTCIELDCPEMQDAKLKACSKFGISYDRVTTIPLRLTSSADISELKARLDMKKRTLIVLEGVSYFLDTVIVGELLKMISELPRGSEMIADFWTSKCCGYKFWQWRPGKCIVSKVLSLLGEPVKFKLPVVDEDPVKSLDAFVKQTCNDNVEVASSEEVYIGVLGLLKRN